VYLFTSQSTIFYVHLLKFLHLSRIAKLSLNFRCPMLNVYYIFVCTVSSSFTAQLIPLHFFTITILPKNTNFATNPYAYFSSSSDSNTLLSTLALYSHTPITDVFSRLWIMFRKREKKIINPLTAELNPIRHLLALVGARHLVHVSGIRVKIIFRRI
jgi:hypothetical protein